MELLTDLMGSRTIWYVHTDDTFLASTSQRALVALLGDFRPNPQAVTWMAATGNLGAGLGWDQRLQRVPAATRLCLDRATWSVATSRAEHPRGSGDLTERERLDGLRDGIFAACATLDADDTTTALTLSGGRDSRSLLVGLAHAGRKVTCLTWGRRESLAESGNDAFLARRLAERFGMRHDYLVLDPHVETARDRFTRFLRAGEGRIQDFRGYIDGLDSWRRIFEAGYSIILRGDAPGWGLPHTPINESWTRAVVDYATLVDDYPTDDLIHSLGLPPQNPPDWLFPAAGETLDGYRDRVYERHAWPACIPAWNQVKCAYAEMVSPLTSRRLVLAARDLPDELRYKRRGFNRVAEELVPDVPFATREADESLERYLARKPVEAELLAELSSDDARRVFSATALDTVIATFERPSAEVKHMVRAGAKAVVPKRLVRRLRPVPKLHLDSHRLAYRMYIASRMAAILRADAAFLSGAAPAER